MALWLPGVFILMLSGLDMIDSVAESHQLKTCARCALPRFHQST